MLIWNKKIQKYVYEAPLLFEIRNVYYIRDFTGLES